MVRLLLAGVLLLAGILYFFLSGGSDSEAVPSTGAQAPVAPEVVKGRESASEVLARPLRMQSQGADPDMEAGESESNAAVAVKRVEMSLADSFANEAVDRGPVARERDTMIRSVIAELKEKQGGDAQIVSLECRTQHCALSLKGDDSDALMKLVDALQDDRGFLGKCESMMLSREGEVISAYLRFPAADAGASLEPSATR